MHHRDRDAHQKWSNTRPTPRAKRTLGKQAGKRFLLWVTKILLVGLFGAVCSILYTQQVRCDAQHASTSKACVD